VPIQREALNTDFFAKCRGGLKKAKDYLAEMFANYNHWDLKITDELKRDFGRAVGIDDLPPQMHAKVSAEYAYWSGRVAVEADRYAGEMKNYWLVYSRFSRELNWWRTMGIKLDRIPLGIVTGIWACVGLYWQNPTGFWHFLHTVWTTVQRWPLAAACITIILAVWAKLS
jgi:hypothetical protein